MTEQEIASKYHVPTYDEFKKKPSSMKGRGPISQLAFGLVYMLRVGGKPPRFVVLNHEFVVELFLGLDRQMITHFEGVQIVHDEKAIFKTAWIF